MNERHFSLRAALPHSYPFLLIDKVLEIEQGKRVACVKNVSYNDEVFHGRSADDPVFPEVYIIEAMAQTSGLLLDGKGSRGAYLSMIRDMRFHTQVKSGDRLVIVSSLFHGLPPLFVFEVKALVGDDVAAQGEITLALI